MPDLEEFTNELRDLYPRPTDAATARARAAVRDAAAKMRRGASPRRRRAFRGLLIAAAVAAIVGAYIVGGALTNAPAPVRAASPVLAFSPTNDWNSIVAPLPSKLQTNNEVSWASNTPFRGGDLLSGWPTDTVKNLPPEGVVVFASLAHNVDDPKTYANHTAPLKLDDGYFLSSGYENQPSPNISLQMIYAHVNGQYVLVQVWFGRNQPSAAQKETANAELARLVVPTQ